MGLFSGGLIIGKISASEIWGAYFWEGLFFFGGGGGLLLSEFYGMSSRFFSMMKWHSLFQVLLCSFDFALRF